MTISQRAIDVTDGHVLGKVGELVLSDWFSEDRSAINSDPQAAEVRTATITGATNAKLYTITINGIDVSFLSGGAASTTTIAAGLEAAVNASPAVRGVVSALAAVAVLTLTGLIPGTTFTLTDVDAQITSALVSAAADADAIPFGTLVCHNGTDATGEALCRLAQDTSFTAQVDTTVFAGLAAGDLATMTVVYEGASFTATAPFNTNNDTTVGDLRTELTTKIGALDITLSGATDTVILTADLAGDLFVTTAGHLGVVTSTAANATSVSKAMLGLSIYSYDVEALTVGQATASSYPANEGVSAMTRGRMWVENSQGVSQGDSVFVELDNGSADVGKLFNTTSATRALIPQLSWYRAGPTADAIADVKLGA